MGEADYLVLGDYNASCSMCGKKMKASQLVKNWQGFYRCPSHNEPRQPQDFVRGVSDTMGVPWSQPSTDIDLAFCTLNGQSAIPGYGLPGCMIPGNSVFDTTMSI